MQLSTVSKAIAGVLVAVISKYFVDHDILIDANTLGPVVEYVIAGLIGFVVVYFAPKNTEPKL